MKIVKQNERVKLIQLVSKNLGIMQKSKEKIHFMRIKI